MQGTSTKSSNHFNTAQTAQTPIHRSDIKQPNSVRAAASQQPLQSQSTKPSSTKNSNTNNPLTISSSKSPQHQDQNSSHWNETQMRFNKTLKSPELFCEYAFYLLMTYGYDMPKFDDYFTTQLKLKPINKYLDIIEDLVSTFTEADAKAIKEHVVLYRANALKLLQSVPKYRLADEDDSESDRDDVKDKAGKDKAVHHHDKNDKHNHHNRDSSNDDNDKKRPPTANVEKGVSLPHDPKCVKNLAKVRCGRCLFTAVRNYFWEEPHIIELYSPLREIVSVSMAREYEGPSIDEDDEYHPLRIIMFVIYFDLFLAAFGLEDYVNSS